MTRLGKSEWEHMLWAAIVLGNFGLNIGLSFIAKTVDKLRP